MSKTFIEQAVMYKAVHRIENIAIVLGDFTS